MNLIKLKYLSRISSGICTYDLEHGATCILRINTNNIVSLSYLISFHSLFKNKFIGKYAILTMVDGSEYYLTEEHYNDLCLKIKINDQN